MTLHKWSEIEEEKLTDSISRKYIMGDRVTMAMFTLKKGCTIQTHSHENEQMSTVLSGAMKFVVEGQEVFVRSGETLRIPPMTPHSAEALEDTENLDVFAPVRSDWLEGNDDYLKKA